MQAVDRLLKLLRKLFQADSAPERAAQPLTDEEWRYFHNIYDAELFSTRKPLHIENFPIGACPIEFVERLKWLSAYPTETFRTFPQRCTICDRTAGDELESIGIKPHHSAGIIWIPSVDRKTLFECSDIIFHYVARHNLQPPTKFIDAVMAMPFDEYIEAIRTIASIRFNFWDEVKRVYTSHKKMDWSRHDQFARDVISAGAAFRTALAKKASD